MLAETSTKSAKKRPYVRRKGIVARDYQGRGVALAKLDKIGIDSLCAMVESGLTYAEIADGIGVEHSAICDWREKQESKNPQLCVRQRLARAMEDSAEALLDRGLIGLQNADESSNAAVNKWRYVAMEYARRAGIRNSRYSERQSVELTGKDGGPIQSQAVVTVYVPANYRDDPKVIESECDS